MIKRYLREFGLRFALGTFRVFRQVDKSGAALLPEARRHGAVALVWALDENGETLSETLVGQLDKLADFETVVVVTAPKYFAALRHRGLFFEALPSPEEIARSGIAGNWDLYLRRRIVRIRQSWSPDFEFTLGSPPEALCANLPGGKISGRQVASPGIAPKGSGIDAKQSTEVDVRS